MYEKRREWTWIRTPLIWIQLDSIFSRFSLTFTMDSRPIHPPFSTAYSPGHSYGLPAHHGSSGTLFRDMPMPRTPQYGDRYHHHHYGNLISDRFLRSSPPPGFMGGSPAYLPPSRKFRTKIRFDFCVFCRNNGEDEQFFLAHTLKDDSGQVICPVLRAYVCPICGATGPVAHTIKYCPQNKVKKRQGTCQFFCQLIRTFPSHYKHDYSRN